MNSSLDYNTKFLSSLPRSFLCFGNHLCCDAQWVLLQEVWSGRISNSPTRLSDSKGFKKLLILHCWLILVDLNLTNSQNLSESLLPTHFPHVGISPHLGQDRILPRCSGSSLECDTDKVPDGTRLKMLPPVAPGGTLRTSIG